jgi:hypothetical protein
LSCLLTGAIKSKSDPAQTFIMLKPVRMPRFHHVVIALPELVFGMNLLQARQQATSRVLYR